MKKLYLLFMALTMALSCFAEDASGRKWADNELVLFVQATSDTHLDGDGPLYIKDTISVDGIIYKFHSSDIWVHYLGGYGTEYVQLGGYFEVIGYDNSKPYAILRNSLFLSNGRKKPDPEYGGEGVRIICLLKTKGGQLDYKGVPVYFGMENGVKLDSQMSPVVGIYLEYLFSGNKNIESVDLSRLTDMTEIPSGSFNGCTNLKSVSMPSSIKHIGAMAFAHSGLEGKLTLPANLETIDRMAFFVCDNLTGDLRIPDKVTTIGDYAFLGCKGITNDLILPNSLTSIAGGAFGGIVTKQVISHIQAPFACHAFDAGMFERTTLIIPKGTIDAYKNTYDWNRFKSLYAGEETDEVDISTISVTLEKINNYWYSREGDSSGQEAIIYDAATPGYSYIEHFYDVFGETNIRGMFGYNMLIASGVEAREIRADFVFGSNDKLQASANGATLEYVDGQTRTPIATLTPTGELKLLHNETSMWLLNERASNSRADALALPVQVKAFYREKEVSIENSSFWVIFERPINIADAAMAIESSPTEYNKGWEISLTDLVDLTDWRNNYSSYYGKFNREIGYYYNNGVFHTDGYDYYDFYGIRSITMTGANSENDLGNLITITSDGITKSLKSAFGNNVSFEYTPVDFARREIAGHSGLVAWFGTLNIINHGASFPSLFRLNIPITVTYEWGELNTIATVTISDGTIEITTIENGTTVKMANLESLDLTNVVIGDVYYNVGSDSFDNTDQSITISQSTNMDQITNTTPGSNDIRNNFTGLIMKVAKGKGSIKVNVKTTGNAQLVIQMGNQTPTIATKTEQGDVVVSYDVTEDTFVYIYAITGSSSARSQRAAGTGIVKIYSITVTPGVTSISATQMNNGETRMDNYFTQDGRKVDGQPTKKGLYIFNGRKVVIK